MKLTTVDTTKVLSRADTIAEAKKNAAKVGTRHNDGSVSVFVKDIKKDVIIGTDGLRHSLRRKLGIISPVTIQIGSILKNSIAINELSGRKNTNGAYVLIGAAKDINNRLFIVRTVVNNYTLSEFSVLYAITTKKEPAATVSPRSTNNSSLSSTDSVTSISNLLDYVNKYFPDILSECSFTIDVRQKI